MHVFSWNRTAKFDGRNLYVYKFEVPSQNGAIVMHRDTDQKIFAGYTGRLFVNKESQQVVRITSDLNLPTDFPIKMATISVISKPVEIAGISYFLPSHSEMRWRQLAPLRQ